MRGDSIKEGGVGWRNEKEEGNGLKRIWDKGHREER